jgi:hypothetical protein
VLEFAHPPEVTLEGPERPERRFACVECSIRWIGPGVKEGQEGERSAGVRPNERETDLICLEGSDRIVRLLRRGRRGLHVLHTRRRAAEP